MNKLYLEDFILSTDTVTEKTMITCPGNVIVKVHHDRMAERWIGVFPHEACRHCSFVSKCCTQDRHKGRVLYFTTSEVRRAQRRRCSRQFMKGGRNPRAGVERTMELFKHRLRHE
ncbi:transposase [Candidatus Pacearchaeota archaeon]|nr:transposase [Candidatus Pacearchaeota archaeon]